MMMNPKQITTIAYIAMCSQLLQKFFKFFEQLKKTYANRSIIIIIISVREREEIF